jgi:hypothetical protein
MLEAELLPTVYWSLSSDSESAKLAVSWFDPFGARILFRKQRTGCTANSANFLCVPLLHLDLNPLWCAILFRHNELHDLAIVNEHSAGERV